MPYRERYLLYNNKISTEHSKEFIAIIIAHELTHQWFGDYVTPIWWSYLWLKEGFATYFEYHIMDKVICNIYSVQLFAYTFTNMKNKNNDKFWKKLQNFFFFYLSNTYL